MKPIMFTSSKSREHVGIIRLNIANIEMRNQYADRCFLCKREVKACAGFFQRMAGRWVVRCKRCVGAGNKVKSEPLTDAQLLSMLIGWKRTGKSLSRGYGILLKEAKRRKLIPLDAQ